MQPKYKVITKSLGYDENDKDVISFTSREVSTLSFLTVKGLPVVSASYTLAEGETSQNGVNVTVIIDEVENWLFQSTNAFDKNGVPIYHGDLLKDADGILYEVMYAVGSYFIVKDDAPLMLLDEHTRKLEVVGNVIENYDLIKVDTSVLTAQETTQ